MTEQINWADGDAVAAVLAPVAARLVAAEMEDVLTATDEATPVTPDYQEQMHETLRRTAREGPRYAMGMLVETTALACEAVFRLAAERGEDPRATLRWITESRWTS